MKKIYLRLGILFLCSLFFSQIAWAEEEILEKKLTTVGLEYVPGEIIVKFKPKVDEDAITNLNSRHGCVSFHISKFAGFRRLRILRKKTVSEMVQLYKKDPNVEYAEPNYIAYALWVPNDLIYSYQWHLDNAVYGGIGMEEAWELLGAPGTPGAGVVVAVIDTGVAYEDYAQTIGRRTTRYYRAPDLAQTNFVAGYDFVNEDTHPNDDEGHGTHVTGTIAQSTNNGIGVAGVAFNCSIMPVKVLDKYGSGTYADVADGIYFAANNGAKIINMSLGGTSTSTTLEDALAHAYNKGVTIVCAAGNTGPNGSPSYPAAYNAYCIAVGATRYDETVSYYSTTGSYVDIAAPGGDLNVDQNDDDYGDGVLQQTFGTTYNDWGYWFYQGTSMACPHVSGVAALIISKGVATTPDKVREVLQSTAEDKGLAGLDEEYGYGIVDAYASLNYLPVPDDTTPPVISNISASNITATTATISWTTDEVATSRVDYGTIITYGAVIFDSSLVTAHSINLSGLSEQTTYYYQVSSTDAAGNSASSLDYTFTTTPTPVSLEVFSDSFEVSEWNGLWTEDVQNDWYRSIQRAVDGRYSAEADGPALDARLVSVPINLQGRTSAGITFSWYIESSLDSGEYLAFDVSTDGGMSWTEKARLKGNIDPENTWHNVSINLTNISSLKIRFRAKMSSADEDADVDMVKVITQ